jgi:hypothetical protein
MPGPLAIEMTVGGLLCDLPALQVKPRVGANGAPSLLSSPAGRRTQRKRWLVAEHDVVPVVGGPR